MLGVSPLIAFIPVTDMAMARTFTPSTLGLVVIEESPFAFAVEAHGTKVRITLPGE